MYSVFITQEDSVLFTSSTRTHISLYFHRKRTRFSVLPEQENSVFCTSSRSRGHCSLYFQHMRTVFSVLPVNKPLFSVVPEQENRVLYTSSSRENCYLYFQHKKTRSSLYFQNNKTVFSVFPNQEGTFPSYLQSTGSIKLFQQTSMYFND